MIINLKGMDPYRAQQVADDTVDLMRRTMRQPGMREAIHRKVEELRADGFFDRFPAPIATQEGRMI